MTCKFPHFGGYPKPLFRLGYWARMSGGAKGVYIALCDESDNRSTRRFELKDPELAELSGVSKRRLGDARTELSEMGMVVCDREPGGLFVYELCDPKTRRPFPGDPRAKVAYKKESSMADAPPADDETPTAPPVVPMVAIAPAASAEETDALPQSMGDASLEGLDLDSCDTSFDFGWNVNPQPNVSDLWPVSDHRRQAVLA
jgi:hypothetical protein